jgi:hypothetical protein
MLVLLDPRLLEARASSCSPIFWARWTSASQQASLTPRGDSPRASRPAFATRTSGSAVPLPLLAHFLPARLPGGRYVASPWLDGFEEVPGPAGCYRAPDRDPRRATHRGRALREQDPGRARRLFGPDRGRRPRLDPRRLRDRRRTHREDGREGARAILLRVGGRSLRAMAGPARRRDRLRDRRLPSQAQLRYGRQGRHGREDQA